MSIFKACDIRGIAGKDLTDAMARKIGLAVGTKLNGKLAIVGGDIRLSTPRLKEVFIQALVESGCRVIDIGTVATPVFYFALKDYAADGGVMITASHNPAEYNGFKLVFGPRPASEADIAEIGELVAAGAQVSGTGSVKAVSVREEYFAYTVSKAEPGRLRVVLDAGNGAAAPFAPQLFRLLGYDVVELYCEPDGNFPNRPPNPALAPNLAALGECVRKTKAALGIAFDGDGDRAGFVDEAGRALDNDDILVLLARSYLEKHKNGTVVYDAKCSMVVPEEISKAGGRPVMARAGHTFSKDAFQREQALLAGEISGHFFLSELGYDDAMFAGLKVASFVEQHGSLAAQIDSIPNYLLTPDIRIPYMGNDKESILEQAAQKLALYHPNRIDGVRIDFADGWAMIRSSVTEPLFTLRFEAKTAGRLKEITNILLAALPQQLQADIITAMASELQEI